MPNSRSWDVQCTWDLYLETGPEKLRINPRKSSYYLAEVTTNGDYEVTFRLNRPQPSFPMTLASGFSVIYPCHISPRDMRSHPIGTGPFKLAEFKRKEFVKVTRNYDYWKPDRPYLDCIEHPVVTDPAIAVLAFIAGNFDMTRPGQVTVPQMNDIMSRVPQAICEWTPGNVNRHLLVNRDNPPFDNPNLRRVIALSIDRQAFVDIIGQGQGRIGGVLQPPPAGLWGMPPEMLRELPGYDPDVQKNRTEGRRIMEGLSYRPDHRLSIKITSQDWPIYRDPAVLLIDQLQQVYIDSELELVDTPQYYPKILRKDYAVALNLQTSGPDPQILLWLRRQRQLERLLQPPGRRADRATIAGSRSQPPQRRAVGDRAEAGDGRARPILFYRNGGTCRQPYVKGLTLMANSPFNAWRMEDAWLDQ